MRELESFDHLRLRSSRSLVSESLIVMIVRELEHICCTRGRLKPKYFWLLITSRAPPKDDKHTKKCTHSLKRRGRTRKNGRNDLKLSKTHLQPCGGRKECLDNFRKAIGVLIYRLTKKKKVKNFTSFLDPPCPIECTPSRASWRVSQCLRDVRACARWVPSKYAMCMPCMQPLGECYNNHRLCTIWAHWVLSLVFHGCVTRVSHAPR